MECLDFTFPIIDVTETWLSDSNCELFDIPGYNFIEKHRNEKTGGGVGIFWQNSIQLTLRDDLSLFNEYPESVFIEIPSDAFHIGQTVLIGTIYRPPGMDLYQFNTLLCDIMEKIQMEKKLCYLLGDYNINLFNYGSPNLINFWIYWYDV